MAVREIRTKSLGLAPQGGVRRHLATEAFTYLLPSLFSAVLTQGHLTRLPVRRKNDVSFGEPRSRDGAFPYPRAVAYSRRNGMRRKTGSDGARPHSLRHSGTDALRSVIRKVLTEVAATGRLPGDHHFFITFLTGAPGVRISQHLKAKYAEQMTIVIQHQFWELKVTDSQFEIACPSPTPRKSWSSPSTPSAASMTPRSISSWNSTCRWRTRTKTTPRLPLIR